MADGVAVAAVDDLHYFFRKPRVCKPRLDAGGNRLIRPQRLGAAAQNAGVTGFQAQTRRFTGHIGARLVDDANYAQGHAHTPDLYSAWPRLEVAYRANRVI